MALNLSVPPRTWTDHLHTVEEVEKEIKETREYLADLEARREQLSVLASTLE